MRRTTLLVMAAVSMMAMLGLWVSGASASTSSFFNATGSLTTPRTGAVAAPLPDGRVLTGFKRSLQHLDEKELRWRCASEGQIGLLER